MHLNADSGVCCDGFARQPTDLNGMFHGSDVPGNHNITMILDFSVHATTVGGGGPTIPVQGPVVPIGNSSRIPLTKQD